MTGLSCAYYLKELKNIGVVEANLLGHGVTLNSTAKITYLQERNYTKIKTLRGYNNAKKYLESQRYGIERLKEIIKTENIKCNFKETPSYIFANKKIN